MRRFVSIAVLAATLTLAPPVFAQSFSGTTGQTAPAGTPPAGYVAPQQPSTTGTPPAGYTSPSLPDTSGTPPAGYASPSLPNTMGTPPAAATQGQALPPVFQGTPQDAMGTAAMPTRPSTPTYPQAPATPGVAATTGMQTPGTQASGTLDAGALPADPCAAYLNAYDVYAICQDRIKRLERMKTAQQERAAKAAEAKKKAQERREAASKPASEDKKEKMRRPGQVTPPTPAPTKVEVVPVEPASATTR